MSLLRLFKSVTKPTTDEQTGLSTNAVSYVNSALKRVMEDSRQLEEGTDCAKHKGKYTKFFMPGEHVKVCQYATQNGVTKVQNHFKLQNLRESTVHYFKKMMYLAEVSKCTKTSNSTKVTILKLYF